MSAESAEAVVTLAGAYLAAGAVFAVPFLWRWARVLDPLAAHATWGFRVVVWPGVVALWPILAARLLVGSHGPAQEWTAHRRAAGRAASRAGGGGRA